MLRLFSMRDFSGVTIDKSTFTTVSEENKNHLNSLSVKTDRPIRMEAVRNLSQGVSEFCAQLSIRTKPIEHISKQTELLLSSLTTPYYYLISFSSDILETAAVG